MEKINDLLLSYGHDVELAAHLGEAVVDMGTKVDEVLPKVDEVLAEGIETCGRGLAEIAKLAAELTDVAVGGFHELSVPATDGHCVSAFGGSSYRSRRLY
jgi:hypothetical protein